MSHSPTLLGGLFGDPAVDAEFTDEARLQAWCDELLVQLETASSMQP